MEEAPTSAQAAATALRFTADGRASNPGPLVISAEELGALILLADIPKEHLGTSAHPDITALKLSSCDRPPWLLETLHAIATTDSLRAAATALVVHHSTLQKRLAQVSRMLGSDVITPNGKLRLQVALLVRRLMES